MIQNQPDTIAALKPITEPEFSRFQKLIYRTAGIHLAPHKKTLLEARLGKHIRQLGLDSFDAYYKHVVAADRGDELIRMLDHVSTNETHFFREPRQFEFLEKKLFEEWRTAAAAGLKPKRIRLWSAGCSSGEEPYSIAMLLLDHFPRHSGWELKILATDLSTRILDKAQAAVWPIVKAQEIPEKFLPQYMLRGTGSQDGKMKAGAEIRSLIQFERLNLNDQRYPLIGRFDAIFCRNVLIYFDNPSRTRVIERLIDRLAPDGYLFVGHAESLSGITDRARQVMPTVYRLGANEARNLATRDAEL
ncbi:MAG: CheR family methyltransferase [Candidatus Binatia bacterium]